MLRLPDELSFVCAEGIATANTNTAKQQKILYCIVFFSVGNSSWLLGIYSECRSKSIVRGPKLSRFRTIICGHGPTPTLLKFNDIRSSRLKKELQTHSVSLFLFEEPRPSNFQECRNVNDLIREGNFTAHDCARGEKPIAEQANSAFGDILCFALKDLLGLFGLFQNCEWN